MRTRVGYVLLAAAVTLAGCDRKAPSPMTAVAAVDSTSAAVTQRAPVPEQARALSDAFASAAASIRPAVVRIDVELSGRQRQGLAQAPFPGPPDEAPDFLERFFDFDFGGPGPRMPAPTPRRGTGSGVIIDDAGHILTNRHVVDSASKVTITLVDGRKLDGQVVGADPLTDVAVVRVAKKPSALSVARVGKSETLRVGEWVMAVGSPLGLAQTVTAGIVSGLERGGNVPSGVSGSRVRRYIQTDAAINPGNSGGPLVNLAGEVVGLNTFINVGPGGSYGYAVAIDQAAAVSATLIKEGRVRYPYIGVQLADVADVPPDAPGRPPSLPAQGAFVADVPPGGPAEKAGLKPGDVITAVDGKPVAGASDVVEAISARGIGSEVKIDYRRGGDQRGVTVKVAELPGDQGRAAASQARLGLSLQTVTPPLARQLGLGEDTRGAVVVAVQPGSVAERVGLTPGEVIVEIDRQAVGSAEQAAKLLRANPNKPHLLRVVGLRGARFVTVPPAA